MKTLDSSEIVPTNSSLWSAIVKRWNDPSIQIPLRLWFAARVLTLLIGVVGVKFGGPITNLYEHDPIYVQSLDARQFSSPFTSLVDPWHRWDTGWYLKIAQYGYSETDGSIIFEPLYPVLMAGVGLVVGDKLLAGLLVSSVASLLFLVALYRLVFLETGNSRASSTTIIVFLAFPTAFYLQAAYTESLFLALTAWALLTAREKKWWLTGIMAGLAALTRAQGWVLFFPIGYEAFIQAPRFWQGVNWPERIRQAIPRLWAIGTAPSAVLLFFMYLYFAGLGTITDAYLKYWKMDVKPPWSAVIDTIGRIAAGTAIPTEIANLLALCLIVAILVFSIARRLKFFYHLYLWPTLLLVLLRYYPAILLNGNLRYVLDFFPMFIVLGVFFSQHKIARLGWIVTGVTLQFLMLFLFVRWLWIS